MSQKKINSSRFLYALSGVVVVGLLGMATLQPEELAKYDSFAEELTEAGVVLYGAWWCPHCENQKKAFEGSFDKINYVECSPGRTRGTSQECKDAGIEVYPTWVFPDGSMLSGEIELKTLADKIGAELPE